MDARLITYRRGMGNFVYHLLHAFAQLPDDIAFILYVDDPGAARFVPTDPRFQIQLLRSGIYPLWEQVQLPLAASRNRLDVLHSPANTAPISLSPAVKLVITIHDVMYLLPRSVVPASPSIYQKLGRFYRSTIVPVAVRRADAVITVSNRSKADIVHHLGIHRDEVRVVSEAPNSACHVIEHGALVAAKARLSLKNPFVLGLAHVDPRKNTKRLIDAFAQVIGARSCPYELVLVGLSTSGQSIFRRHAEGLGIADRVRMLGFVSEDDLVALYNLAAVFAYPSLYEGFGLPVLESMACGTPVVTSPTGAIPEVAEDAALMVDPNSSESIAEGLNRMLGSREEAEKFRSRGFDRVRQFSWQRTASETIAVYNEVTTRA